MSARTSQDAAAFLLRPYSSAIARLIWQERGISRIELARRTGLASSTISQVVAALQQCGLVSEEGVGPSRGGRRPTLLRFEDEAFCLLGIDLRHEHVAVALTDLRGHVLAWEERSHRVRRDPDGARALTAQLADAVMDRWQRSRERLVAIGVGVPSPVYQGDDAALPLPTLPDWGGRLGLEPLTERHRVPLLLENDANLGALAEQWWGAGRGIRHVTYVLLGGGVGSGQVIDGHLDRGGTGMAGELGHIPLDPRGPECTCGMRGCLTTLVDIWKTMARAERMMAENPNVQSRLADRPISIASIEEAARAGDPLARRVVDETAQWLALGLNALFNLNDPSLVVLGGALTRLGGTLLGALRPMLKQNVYLGKDLGDRVVVSPLGERAIALGAATHVLDRALSDLGLFPTVRAALGAAS